MNKFKYKYTCVTYKPYAQSIQPTQLGEMCRK